MYRKPVDSSNLYAVGYENDVLEIEFRSGGIYRYFDVPQNVYDGLMSAESMGSFFHYNIKTVGYRWEKVHQITTIADETLVPDSSTIDESTNNFALDENVRLHFEYLEKRADIDKQEEELKIWMSANEKALAMGAAKVLQWQQEARKSSAEEINDEKKQRKENRHEDLYTCTECDEEYDMSYFQDIDNNVCPECGGKLKREQEWDMLVCKRCGEEYGFEFMEIIDGICPECGGVIGPV